MKTTQPVSPELSAQALDAYRRDGYLILRECFNASEVAAMQQEAERLAGSDLIHPDNIRTPLRSRLDGVKELERIDPVIDVSDLFLRLVQDERITLPLQQIFGEPACLFKDKLIFKHPGISGYSMHQDFAWWQPQGQDSPLPDLNPDQILSVMVAIDAADALNGAIELFPGYHDRLITPPGLLANMRGHEAAQIDRSRGILGTTAPGDVIIFHSLTPHCSERNNSTGSRRQLYLSYNAASAGDVYASQQEHYRAYVKAAWEKNGRTTGFYR